MHFIKTSLFLAALAISLAACRPAIQPTPSATPTAAVPTVRPSDTPIPTPTPLPGKLILAGSADAGTRDWLSALAAQSGLSFEERPSLAPADLPPEARVVVIFEPDASLPDLLASAPQAQFAVLGSTSLEPAANLTVIRAAADRQAFAAGYLAVLLSPDWRAAGLISADRPDLGVAFRNGGGYFCGDCMPGWPLRVSFPVLSSTAAAASDGAAWAAEVDALFDTAKAEVFYLSEAAYRPEVFAALAGRVQVARQVVALGSLPPPPELRSQWAVTVGVDALPALQRAMPELLAGRSAGALEAGLLISDINPAFLTPGKQALFEQMLADLEGGLIRISPVE